MKKRVTSSNSQGLHVALCDYSSENDGLGVGVLGLMSQSKERITM